MIEDLLTDEQLFEIRSRVDAGQVDDLDAGALLDHISAITESFEAFVTRTAEHNNQAQAVLSELEIKNAKQEHGMDALRAIAGLIAAFYGNPDTPDAHEAIQHINTVAVNALAGRATEVPI